MEPALYQGWRVLRAKQAGNSERPGTTSQHINQGHLVLAEELNAPTWVYHDPAVPDVHALADYIQWLSEIRHAFLDLHVTIEDLIAEGDEVAVRYTWRRTNTGAITRPMPLSVTGKQVAATG